MINADRPEWVPVFTGLSVEQFQELVGIVAGRGGEQHGVGRRWGLSLPDRVLLTTVYYRTNLTFRQIALLFGISKSAANRVVEHIAPLLVLPPVNGPPTGPRSPDTVLIVDGTLIPTHDRSVSASSKNYRYSVNMQVVIPYRKPGDGSDLPEWQEQLNTVHKRVRARVEHALAHMKSWNIPRNCRRKRLGAWYATRGVALLRNLAMTS